MRIKEVRLICAIVILEIQIKFRTQTMRKLKQHQQQ